MDRSILPGTAPALLRRSRARRHRKPGPRRRILALVVLTALALSVAGPATANGDSEWPTSGGVGMRNHQPAAAGPVTEPGLRWRSEPDDLDGWTVDGGTVGTGGDQGDLVLSSTGDLIATTTRTVTEEGVETDQGAIMALDPEDGSLRWVTTGLDDGCRPTIDDAGRIWAMQVLDDDTRQPGDDPDASRALVALDPDDGTVIPGVRYTGGDGVELNPTSRTCGSYGLQLAADGAVLTLDNTAFDPTFRAIEPDGSPRWVNVFDRGCDIQPWVYAPGADAGNADRVYLASRERRETCPYPGNALLAVDLATGTVTDDLALPGVAFGPRLAQAVAEDGDVFVAIDGPRGSDPVHLIRVTDPGTMAIDWQLDIDPTLSATSPDCAAQVCANIRSLAVAGDRLVAREGNRVVSIDATNGQLEWRDLTGATGPLIVDADGNAYTGRLSGTTGPRLAVLSPTGDELVEIDGSGGLTGITALGPIDAEGTLFGRDGSPAWFALTGGAGPLPQCAGQVAPDAGFTDVVENSTHDAAIDCVVFFELAQGIGDGLYAPSRSVSRQQMASFIARLIDASDRDLPSAGSAFTDVSGTHADNIERLAAAGIVQGREPGLYDPTSPVRRDQMASFLVRAFEFIVGRSTEPADVAFTDIAGNTHEDNIRRVAGLGFTQGLTATSYAPDNPVRRDQMASFLTRALESLVEDEGRIPPRS